MSIARANLNLTFITIIIIIISYLPYLHNTKKFIYSSYSWKARRPRKPPGLWESHLTYINKLKTSIFVLKLRRFDKRVTETGGEFQILDLSEEL